MKLHEVSGRHLTEAYAILYPAEAEFLTADFDRQFELWLLVLREGDLEHQLSLGADYTGRKTRALLLLLDHELPPSLPQIIHRLGLTQATAKERMQKRAERLRRREEG